MNKQDEIPGRASISHLEACIPILYPEYKELVTPSEVPNEFHIFGFMTMLSALVGNQIYFEEGNDTIYPNLWTLFLAPSGVGRKSTAINPVIKVLAKTKKVNLLPSRGSPEGFFTALADFKGIGLRHDSELGALLGALQRDYQKGFADELCELYDPLSAPLVKKLTKTTVKIPEVALTWLAATTPSSLNKCSGHDRIAGGFLPRWNIVFDTPSRNLISFRPRKCPGYFDRFVEQLVKLRPKTRTRMFFSPPAQRVFHHWYVKDHNIKGHLGIFVTRIYEVVKKYAVLLALLDRRDEVCSRDIITASEFGNYFIHSARRLLNYELSENQFDSNCKKIKVAIKHLDSNATTREIMRGTHLKKKDFELSIDTLYASGEINVTKGKVWYIDEEITNEY